MNRYLNKLNRSFFKQGRNRRRHHLCRVASGLLAVSLLWPTSLVWATDEARSEEVDSAKETEFQSLETGKSEIIYANLTTDGQVNEVYIVNRFSDPSGTTLRDYGDYTDVQMLSRDGTAVNKDGYVEVTTGEHPLYYQGHAASKNLPWTFQFNHSLDDKDVTAKALSGATGKWRLKIDIDAVKETASTDKINPWADVTMLQMTLTLPVDCVRNLETTSGTIAEAGSNYTIAFVVMPGTETSTFEVRADVDNFHMPAMQVAGVPFSMDLSEFDVSSIMENDEIKRLQDGTRNLSEGSRQLADGLAELTKANELLSNGMEDLRSGGDQLVGSGNKMTGGIDRYAGGLNKLVSSGGYLSEGLKESAQGAGSLAQGVKEIKDGLVKYMSGVDAYIDGVNQLADGVIALDREADQLMEGLDSLAEGMNQLAGGDQLLESSATFKNAFAKISAELTEADNAVDFDQLKQDLAGLAAAGQQLAAGSQQFLSSLDEPIAAAEGLSQVADGLAEALMNLMAGL
ncbi:MAG TPA: hypothetical protein GX717_07550, partial [Clostridiaceae bacterium]|nr:hypothetical protein [Clostridiaceae bacterium]